MDIAMETEWKRGMRVMRDTRSGTKRKGTVTHYSHQGWVVVEDEPWDFSEYADDPRLSSSAADSGTPDEGGWLPDPELP